MRIERMVAIGCLALAMAGHARGQQYELAIGLDNAQAAPFALLAKAEATAALIYSTIGVKLSWRSRAGTEIWIQFDTNVPAGVHPGAMGYAVPYGKAGTRIHILLDRVYSAGSERLAGMLLGHVMAHELGHVLEGISRHSDSGLMKARWDSHDYDQMLVRSLSFSSEDMALIESGLLRWAARSRAAERPPRNGSPAADDQADHPPWGR